MAAITEIRFFAFSANAFALRANCQYLDNGTIIENFNSDLDVTGVDLNNWEEVMAMALTSIEDHVTAAGYTGYSPSIVKYLFADDQTITARSFSTPSRVFTTAFQPSTTRDADVRYTVRIANALTLSGGAAGDVVLEYADNSGFTTNVVELSRFGNSNTGGLVIGLSLNDAICGAVTGIVPANKYVRIRQATTVGTPTYTLVTQREVLL